MVIPFFGEATTRHIKYLATFFEWYIYIWTYMEHSNRQKTIKVEYASEIARTLF